MARAPLAVAVLLLAGVTLALAMSVQPGDFSTLYLENGAWKLVSGLKDSTHGVAWCYYKNDMNSDGWGKFAVSTNVLYSAEQQVYAAGYLEGALSYDLIWANWQNMYVNEYFSANTSAPLGDWITSNWQWMVGMVADNPTVPYWQQVGLVVDQLQGMVDGYNAYCPSGQQLGLYEFLLQNMDGDMEDLSLAFSEDPAAAMERRMTSLYHQSRRLRHGGDDDGGKKHGGNKHHDDDDDDVDEQPQPANLQQERKLQHCSALIKIADDYSNMWAGHTTWSSFYNMVRMFKSYTLPVYNQTGTVAAPTVTFSGYPATLPSVDDFYVTSQQLVVIETTNGINNASLYQLIQPKCVLSWVRTVVANRMAASAPEWVQIFSMYNSGTYNNQWLVLDLKLWQPGQIMKDNTFWVMEQIPDFVQSQDVTPYLQFGYWSSYNIPFFEYIYNVSGFRQMYEKYGDWFSYQLHPRAQIFRRDANNVKNSSDMKAMLRYNDWKNDPLSLGNPGNAISSRFDLVTHNGTDPYLNQAPFGGVDSKIVSYRDAVTMRVWAQSGPTRDDVPHFSWNDNNGWPGVLRMGQPTDWSFDWKHMDLASLV